MTFFETHTKTRDRLSGRVRFFEDFVHYRFYFIFRIGEGGVGDRVRHAICLQKNARCFIDVPHLAFTPILAVSWLCRFFAVVECLLPVAWLFGPAELVA